MNFPFYIAKRYLFSKSSNNTINIITFIAFLGVVIGTLSLFIVLSGFSGLKTFSVSFLNISDPDLKITSIEGKTFEFPKSFQKNLEEIKGIASFTKVVEERAFFSYHNKEIVAYIKGVDSNYLSVNKIDTALIAGNWLQSNLENVTVVGNGISRKLSLGIYDFLEPLKIYVPKAGLGYLEDPREGFNMIQTQNIGIYALTEDVDNKYVFTDIKIAQNLLSYTDDQISAIEIKVISDDFIPIVKSNLEKILEKNYRIETREQLNALFYKMLNTENLVLYFIFTLVLIIALFNVIGAIIMMILDKKENLKTLSNLGLTISEIRQIFVLHGFLLTIFGLLIGLIIGSILIYLQIEFQLFMITKSLPYPVEFTFVNLGIVIVTIVVLGFLASLIASSRISAKVIHL
ncbi:MAG: FtsX-like permease family protein [Flavobacteriaceae bacterium]|nr:FtsX-like permease family protein [Flavobacteriaceae bacterium]